MIQIMTDTGCNHDPEILFGDLFPKFTHVYDPVHHLSYAETMTKVMERIVSVILLNAELRCKRNTNIDSNKTGARRYTCTGKGNH